MTMITQAAQVAQAAQAAVPTKEINSKNLNGLTVSKFSVKVSTTKLCRNTII